MTCRGVPMTRFASILLASVALSCSGESQNSREREQQEGIARVQAIAHSTRGSRERMRRQFDAESARLGALSDAELCDELTSRLRAGYSLQTRGNWGTLLEVEAKKRGNPHLQKYLQSMPADALATVSTITGRRI